MYSTKRANIFVANSHFPTDSHDREVEQNLFHTPRRVKKSKRFSDITNVSQKHYYLESKRRKMLAKRARYSKKKKFNQKRLFYLKNTQHLIDEKDSVDSNKIDTIKTKELNKNELFLGSFTVIWKLNLINIQSNGLTLQFYQGKTDVSKTILVFME